VTSIPINARCTRSRVEFQELYQKLADLVADGSLSAAVENVYARAQFKQAIDRSLRSNRSGKILSNSTPTNSPPRCVERPM
jgi:hypothetical protein